MSSYCHGVLQEGTVVYDPVSSRSDPHPHIVPQLGDPSLHPVQESSCDVLTVHLRKQKEFYVNWQFSFAGLIINGLSWI